MKKISSTNLIFQSCLFSSKYHRVDSTTFLKTAKKINFFFLYLYITDISDDIAVTCSPSGGVSHGSFFLSLVVRNSSLLSVDAVTRKPTTVAALRRPAYVRASLTRSDEMRCDNFLRISFPDERSDGWVFPAVI